MRVRNRDGSLAQPGPLIEAAQRYQLLPSVDRWVVQNSLRMPSAYRGMLKSRELSISINLTGQSLGDEACVDLIVDSMRSANLPPGCITIELTEQAAVKNLARAGDVVKRLSLAGCKFALDDVGTGTNSLAYLKNLQLSHIKIDGSFVRDILTNTRSQSTVKGMVELAKAFKIGTVAEYVENQGSPTICAASASTRRKGTRSGSPSRSTSCFEHWAPMNRGGCASCSWNSSYRLCRNDARRFKRRQLSTVVTGLTNKNTP